MNSFLAALVGWIALLLAGAYMVTLGFLRGGSLEMEATIATFGRLRLVTKREKRSAEVHLKRAARNVSEPGESVDVALRNLRRPAVVLSRKRVLWVDDHHERNVELTFALRSLPLDVTLAASSRVAQRYLSEGRGAFDLVITDLTRAGDANAGLDLLRYMSDNAPLLAIVYSDRTEASREGTELWEARAEQAHTEFKAKVVTTPTELFAEVLGTMDPKPFPQTVWGTRLRSVLLKAIGQVWRSRRPLVVGVTSLAVAIVAFTGVLVALALNPPHSCVPRGVERTSTLANWPTSECIVPVGASQLDLDCKSAQTIPLVDFSETSRRYRKADSGDSSGKQQLAPSRGNGTVMVQDSACLMESPAINGGNIIQETALQSRALGNPDQVVVVDFLPDPRLVGSFGVSVRGTAVSRGVGVYLFNSGGGYVAENPDASKVLSPISRPFTVQWGSNSYNRLVICVQGDHVVAWLNNQSLGSAKTTVLRQGGGVILSVLNADQIRVADVLLHHVAVFSVDPLFGCGGA